MVIFAGVNCKLTLVGTCCLPLKVVLGQSCPTLATPWAVALPDSCSWDSPGEDTGVGCQALLQGIFLTQGSNPGLLHCGVIPDHLSRLYEY